MARSISLLKVPIGADRRDPRWQVSAICLVLAAMTFAVFGQTKDFGFVNFDDGVYVYKNALVASGLSLKGFAWVFTHADCNLYHPLTMLSLMANHQLHGLQPGGYHSANVLLHAASVILLFLILGQMTGTVWRSAFVAALFAIHPLRVESVAWVAERKDVLSAFFFMVTLGTYAYYVRKPNSLARYLMVAAAFIMALLSKPTVVTLPFVLLLLDYWPLYRFEQPGKLPRLILEKIPLLALAVGVCAMTVLGAEKMLAPTAGISMPSRLGNALVSYVVYLRQMVWPEGLAVFYPRPAKGYPDWTLAFSFLLLGLMTGGILAFQGKRHWLLVGWLWYLGMLTPMIGIVQVGAFAHADRFTYLPQIGIYLAVTWLVAEWWMKWLRGGPWGVALGGVTAGVLVMLMVCAWRQTRYWKNTETLCRHTLACTTNNGAVNYNFGLDLFEKGRLDEAITCFRNALQTDPDWADAQSTLGSALLQKGRVDEATTCFQKAFEINPDLADAHSNLGNALLQEGKVDEAIAHSRQALEITPDFAEAHLNLGNALLQSRKLDEAIFHLQEALLLRPDFPEAHGSLGVALAQRGRVDEAISHFQKALQLKPGDPGIENNFAWLLATAPQPSLRNGVQAVELAEQADALTGGENPIILHTLAASYAETGRFSEAMATAQHALHLAEAQSNHGLAGSLQSEMKLYQAGKPFGIPEQPH
jgi:tetratricopeptide (TPR) repeat protein